MKELSLHILDVFYNSVKAGASLIKLTIHTDTKLDRLTITLTDNGCGMDKEFLQTVLNPFTTTRTTRKVGLGLPLFSQSALRCEGDFRIYSKKNLGTVLKAVYRNSHIDRAPLGDMDSTLLSMLGALENCDLIYRESFDDKEFSFDTREFREVLGEEVSLMEPDVQVWLSEFIDEGRSEIKKENK